MSILQLSGTSKTRKFADQDFFSEFNWHNFNPGDIVWLEDYEASDAAARICGVYVGGNEAGDIFIRLVPNPAGQILARTGVDNLLDMSSDWWMKFLK